MLVDVHAIVCTDLWMGLWVGGWVSGVCAGVYVGRCMCAWEWVCVGVCIGGIGESYWWGSGAWVHVLVLVSVYVCGCALVNG